jgi:hypothetical protein
VECGVNEVFPFVVGSGRSGTTLLRNVFDAHSELAMCHEAHFIAPFVQHRSAYERKGRFDADAFVTDLYRSPNFRRQDIDEAAIRAAMAESPPSDIVEAVRVVMAVYATAAGKRLYGDKTPGYVTDLELLGAAFPEARFIHVIRDGRDVALAYLDRDEWGPSSLGDAAHYWRSRVTRGRAAGRALGPDRYREVRYEDMVDDPERVTRDLCTFLGLEFEDAMMLSHERGREFIAGTKDPGAFVNLARPITKGMREWRTQMDPDDVVLYETIAGDLLTELGYETTGVAASVATRTRAVVSALGWHGKRVTARVQPYLRRAWARLGGRRPMRRES